MNLRALWSLFSIASIFKKPQHEHRCRICDKPLGAQINLRIHKSPCKSRFGQFNTLKQNKKILEIIEKIQAGKFDPKSCIYCRKEISDDDITKSNTRDDICLSCLRKEIRKATKSD